jgi:hypothetical protein
MPHTTLAEEPATVEPADCGTLTMTTNQATFDYEHRNHNVPRAIAISVRDRGVEVLTAYEDDHHQVPDPILLQRATTLGRPLFTMDDDLLAEAAMLQSQGDDFGGVIYSHQRRLSRSAGSRRRSFPRCTSLDRAELAIYLSLRNSHSRPNDRATPN